MANSAAGEPHPAIFLSLYRFRLPDLLSAESACRSLRRAVAGDPLLWRHIVVEPPLSKRLTDASLLRLAMRAGGLLESLALVDCLGITRDALFKVGSLNPRITKLFVAGHSFLTGDEIVMVLKFLCELGGKPNQLVLSGISMITKDHLETLHSLLQKSIHHHEDRKPFLYHLVNSVALYVDAGRPIDIEICPKCQQAAKVYDCPRENCRECRACFMCINRCIACGVCVGGYEIIQCETVCGETMCMPCWIKHPKCSTCNRPYCCRLQCCGDLLPRSSGSQCKVCLCKDPFLSSSDDSY